jgi:SSS family solute:Na+ symporter
MLIGTLLWAYYQLSKDSLPAHLYDTGGKIIADRVFPYFLTTKIPAGIAGLFMAALMSAAMSTMSSDLNCLSAVGVEDYYRKLRPASNDKERLLAGKVIVAICGAIAIGIGGLIAWRGESALTLYYAATAILSAGLAGMFLLAFFSARANKQGLWIGIGAALLFTGWAVLTSPGTKGSKALLDLGEYNYAWPAVMIGVIAHLIVLIVGWLGSFCFFAAAKADRSMTFWGWLEMRRSRKPPPATPSASAITGISL